MMLKIYDSNHNYIGDISEEKDLRIERTLSDCSEVLSFSFIPDFSIKEEMYLRTSGDRANEYVIKEVDPSNMPFVDVVAKNNVEGLQVPVSKIDSGAATINDIMSALFTLTDWTYEIVDTITKKRSVSMENTTLIDVLDRIREFFLVEMEMYSITKKVVVKEKFGSDKGVCFIDGMNLKKLSIKSDTNDFATRIIPIGADNLTIESVNDGKNYVENYSYSSKIKTIFWIENNYSDAQALKDDAEYKLNEICRPKKSYTAEIIDLANANPDYDDMSFDLGDTITIRSQKLDTSDKQRIVKIVEYPENPEKNSVELGNTMTSFEDINKSYASAAETLKNVSKSGIIVGNKVYLPDGTIVSDAIDNTNIRVDGVESGLSDANSRIGDAESGLLEANNRIDDTNNKLKLSQEEINRLTDDVGIISDDMQDALARQPVVESDTEPEKKYTGMLWRHTGTVSGMIAGATYRWNGAKWTLYLFSAENISVKDLAALQATIGGWRISNNQIYGTIKEESGTLQDSIYALIYDSSGNQTETDSGEGKNVKPNYKRYWYTRFANNEIIIKIREKDYYYEESGNNHYAYLSASNRNIYINEKIRIINQTVLSSESDIGKLTKSEITSWPAKPTDDSTITGNVKMTEINGEEINVYDCHVINDEFDQLNDGYTEIGTDGVRTSGTIRCNDISGPDGYHPYMAEHVASFWGNSVMKCSTSPGTYWTLSAFTSVSWGYLSWLVEKNSNDVITIKRTGVYVFSVRFGINSITGGKRVEIVPFINGTRVASKSTSHNTTGDYTITKLIEYTLRLSIGDTVCFKIAPIDSYAVQVNIADCEIECIDYQN